jgi:hypothetical protein
LTAAQRKSEEKEKESKENKKDSFLKKMFGKITGFLGGIFKNVSKVAGAGLLALLGAGALYALAKLIESPSWKTVAGVIEYVLNKLDDIFTWANNVGGPLGVLGTALALWYGTKGILKLAGIAVKALGKKFLGKLGLTAATEAATGALGSKESKLGLLGKLGLIGFAFAGVTAAIVLLGEELEKFRKKAADKRAMTQTEQTNKAIEEAEANPAKLERLRLARETEIRVARLAREGTAAAESRAKTEADLKRIKAAQAEALRKTQTAREAAVFGGGPKQISENLAKLFKDAFNSTTFEGNAEQRVGQVKGLIGGISKRLLTSKSFQALSDIDKQGFIKKLQSAEGGAFNLVKGRGLISKQVLFGRGDQAGGARDKDATDAEKKKFMLDITALQKELLLLRKDQIGKLGLADAVDADANVKRMKLLIDRLERNAMVDLKKGGGIDFIGSGNQVNNNYNNLSTPMVAPLVIAPVTGNISMYMRN